MSLSENFTALRNNIPPGVELVIVSKKQPAEKIKELYDLGQRIFGENKVQELLEKKDLLPADIQWHFIGHLQTNKVKYIAPFIQLIHSVDSPKLAAEIDKQAKQCNRIIDCLLEIYIASEETKYGFSFEEAEDFIIANSQQLMANSYIRVVGLMGMASNTTDKEKVRSEFKSLANFYNTYKTTYTFRYLSMGMSNDYPIAIEEGSNMVRIGSAIFI